MRILLLHQYFLEKNGPGGARFNSFANHWAKKGHKITVITSTVNYLTGHYNKNYSGKIIEKEKLQENVSVFRCFTIGNANKNFFRRFLSQLSFVCSATAAAILLARKHDIIIATSPPLSIIMAAFVSSKIGKKPFVFEVRDLWPKFAIDLKILKNRPAKRISEAIESFAYQQANQIVSLTPAFTEYIVNEKNIPAEKVTYLPNSADFDIVITKKQRNIIREKYGWGKKFVVLYSGAHGKANDLWQILETAKIMENKKILFVLLGDGNEKLKLQEAAERNRLQNIVFLAPVSKTDAQNITNAADLCLATLHPSLITTYPNKVFDAMACKKPIILTIDGAARKLVEDANAGFFVKPNKPVLLKKAIISLFKDKEKARILGQNGYFFARKNFDRKKWAVKYLDLLVKISGKKD